MDAASLALLDRDALIALILQQQAVIEELRAEIEALKRSAKRQAGPFSKGTRKAAPKKPGRKPGRGLFKNREAPAPETLSEPPIDVPVVEAECPKCGGELDEGRVEEASIVDLPEAPKPRVRLFRVQVRRCKRCKTTVRGRHPDLAPDQRGATAHRLGPRLRTAAQWLHYGLGVPVRKLTALLAMLVGVRGTQGAVTLDAIKQAKAAIGSKYQELCDSIASAPYVHTDDTGWREGGSPRWLMVFETDAATVYQIRERHRGDEVRERIPTDYGGVMITDRAAVYDAEAFAAVAKQKCLSHVQRSIAEVLQEKTGRAQWFGSELKHWLKQALNLWRERRSGPVASDFASRVDEVKTKLTTHLRDRTLTDPDNQRLLNELGRCHDRSSLLRFLDDPRIEPTNNRAERALRPAVIARKTSQCTKTATGSHAFAVWTSVVATLARTHSHSPAGSGLLDALVQLAHPAQPQSR